MTSRRDFLKVTAIAPFAVPAIAKAAAAPSYASGGYVRGVSGPLIGEHVHQGSFYSVNEMRKLHGLTPLDIPDAITRRMWVSDSAYGAPNRLYGAYINEDGDAV